MATTDARLAWEALRILDAEGVRFVLLHGLDRLGAGRVSDVDVAVDEPPIRILARTRRSFADAGLFPVVVWPYDIGGTSTVFYVSADASNGVQLDLLFDECGSGHYGIRSSGLLRWARTCRGLPVLAPEAEVIYLWQKRQRKRQAEALPTLVARAATLDPDTLMAASREITGGERAARSLLEGDVRLSRPSRVRPLRQVRRLGSRVRDPVGWWVHVRDRSTARLIGERFGRILPRVRVTEVPGSGPARLRWFFSTVQPVRLRPGVVVSVGPVTSGVVTPDLVLGDVTGETAVVSLVAAMASRSEQ